MAAEDRDLNRDPLSDEPGSHPIGTGVGAAGGALAGAAAGVVGGPAGMAVGGVIGAVVGGLAGSAAAEAVNPTAEEAYWRENYNREPYYESGRSFDDYGPAYRHGLEARSRYDNWDSAEPYLASEWDSRRGGSSLDWQKAQPASRAAWDRVDPHYRGDRPDGDLSHYGTGMVSTDSTLRTGGPGVTPDDKASFEGRHRDDERRDEVRRDETTHMQAREPGSTNVGSGSMGWGSMGATSTMTGGTLGATTGMDASYTAGTTTGHDMGTTQADTATRMGSPGANADLRTAAAHSGSDSAGRGSSGTGVGGTAASVGAAQASGRDSGDREDTIAVLKDLVETSKDGEYGFEQCAQRASRADLKSIFSQRADDCRRGAQQLQEQIRALGGSVEDSGSTMGSVHRGWVSARSALTGDSDKAVLEEAERGEDNALARYRKALQKPLPEHVRQIVQKQADAVQRNHDQVKRLRDEARAQA